MTHNVEQKKSKGKLHFSPRRQGHFSASRKRGKSLRVLNGKVRGKGTFGRLLSSDRSWGWRRKEEETMAKSGGAQRGQRSEGSRRRPTDMSVKSSQSRAFERGEGDEERGKDSRGVDESLYRHSTVSVASRVRQQKGGGKKIFFCSLLCPPPTRYSAWLVSVPSFPFFRGKKETWMGRKNFLLSLLTFLTQK